MSTRAVWVGRPSTSPGQAATPQSSVLPCKNADARAETVRVAWGPVSWVRLKERSSVGVPVGTRELALAPRVQLRGLSSCTHLRATEPVVSRKTHRSPAGPRGEETAQFTN